MTDTNWQKDTHPLKLNQHTLYRIPASAVSYTPALANVRVWWTGEYRQLPANGGRMALFRFAQDGHTWQGQPTVWLRPHAVVRHE